MNVNEPIWDEDIYPRERRKEKTIHAYSQALDAGAQFPPIEVQRVTNYPNKEAEVFIILDGVHRWEASRRNRIDEIDVTEWMPNSVDYKESQLILLLEGAERNRRHGATGLLKPTRRM